MTLKDQKWQRMTTQNLAETSMRSTSDWANVLNTGKHSCLRLISLTPLQEWALLVCLPRQHQTSFLCASYNFHLRDLPNKVWQILKQWVNIRKRTFLARDYLDVMKETRLRIFMFVLFFLISCQESHHLCRVNHTNVLIYSMFISKWWQV